MFIDQCLALEFDSLSHELRDTVVAQASKELILKRSVILPSKDSTSATYELAFEFRCRMDIAVPQDCSAISEGLKGAGPPKSVVPSTVHEGNAAGSDWTLLLCLTMLIQPTNEANLTRPFTNYNRRRE
jgi:hypothetical protein